MTAEQINEQERDSLAVALEADQRRRYGSPTLSPIGFQRIADAVINAGWRPALPVLAAGKDAEIKRLSSLVRAIEDSRLDPARAIVKADRIAGAALIDLHEAREQLAAAGRTIAAAVRLVEFLEGDGIFTDGHSNPPTEEAGLWHVGQFKATLADPGQ